jgi:hypothetical protein
MGRSCGSGEPGADGSRCAYVEHQPRSDGGWQAWDVLLRCSGQIRVIPGAVIGIDFGAAFAVAAALGYDTIALAELLPAGEAGMIAALNERLKRDSA